ncbi:MAG: hypothetical protein AAFP89_05765 [Bacteroidota bacterium]
MEKYITYIPISMKLMLWIGVLGWIGSCTPPMFQRPSELIPEVEVLSVDSIQDASVRIRGKLTGSTKNIEELGFVLSDEGEPSIQDGILEAKLDSNTQEFELDVSNLFYEEDYQVKAVVTTPYGFFITPSFLFRSPSFVSFDIPCSPPQESITFFDNREFEISRLEETSGSSYNSFVLIPKRAIFRYYIFLLNSPKPRIYTTDERLSLTDDEIHIYFVNGGLERKVESGQEVYIQRNPVNNQLEMTFCDLSFMNYTPRETGRFTLP